MPQAISCPACKRQYACKPELAGKRAKCKCGAKIQFPPAEEEILTELDVIDEPPAEEMLTAMDVLDDDEPAFAVPDGDLYGCRNCGAALPAGAAICVSCGFNQRTGETARTTVVAGPAPRRMPPPSYRRYEEFSKARMLAGRICIVLSVLLYLGGTCFGVAGMLAMGAAPAAGNVHPGGAQAAANMPFGLVGAALMIYAAGILLVATTYLFCGLNIRAGGHVSVIVALAVSSLHSMFLGAQVVSAVSVAMENFQHGDGPLAFIGVGISALITAAILQLVYYCIRVLLEPR